MGTDFRDYDNDGKPDIVTVALNGETIASRVGAGVLNVDLPEAGELSLNYVGEDGWADVLSLRRLGLSVKIR
jgi:hypothetical protein